MEENFDNVPQEQDAQQNEQQNTGYQYSYGSGQYQSNNYNNYDSNNNQNYNNQEDTSVMSMGDWLLTVLVLLIPCAGIILYFVWAFGNGNVNRRNYCRAYLIYWAITTVLSIIFIVIFAGVMSSMGGYYY